MKPELLQPELLRKLLRYEPSTGKIFWKKRSELFFENDGRSSAHRCSNWNSRYAETEAFTAKDRGGYFRGQILKKSYSLHRVAWALHYGKWPIGQIDHINGNPEDNRILNLRDVSQTENARNQKLHVDSSTGYVGVTFRKLANKWRAQIRAEGKNKHLGYFDNMNDAIDARKSAETLHGYHKNHGRKS